MRLPNVAASIAGMLAAGVLGATLTTTTTGAPTIYSSGSHGEKVTQLPVTKSGVQADIKQVVYCVDLNTGPVRGEILHVDGEFEVTNDLGYYVMVANQMLLADSCTATSGTEIGEAQSTNITPDIHHGSVSRSAVFTCPWSKCRRYAVMVAWSAGWSAVKPGATIKVEQDYGTLSVLRWS